MKVKFLMFVLILSCFSINAQKINSNWYFGDKVGLNFNASSSSTLSNGTISSDKSIASVSDSNGNLLFYTDGKTVYNKQFAIMQNGNGTLLRTAIPKGYESVMIIPIQGTNKYCIVTEKSGSLDITDYTFESVYYYSIVDLDLNGGLGKVIVLNKALLASTGVINNGYFRFHNMTSTLHSTNGYWLIIKPNEKFYSFHIDQNILNNTPSAVISQVNCQPTTQKAACSLPEFEFSLKASPSTNNLASVINRSGCLGYGYVKRYDFNNTTGLIENCQAPNLDTPGFIACDFSTDGNYVYALKNKNDGSNQTEVLAYNINNLMKVKTMLFSSSQTYVEGNVVQRAIDGLIYFTTDYFSRKVHVINNSNNIQGVSLTSNYKTFNRNIGEFPKLIPFNEANNCESDIIISNTVNTVDNRSAQNSITASNIINNGATANYDAGNSVILKSGFNAKQGSNFRAFIEGCNLTSSKSSYTKSNTVFNSKDIEKEFRVYPNPTNDKVLIESIKNFSSWNLSSLFGQQIYSGTSTIKQLKMSKLPIGVYILSVTFKDGSSATKKIIKN